MSAKDWLDKQEDERAVCEFFEHRYPKYVRDPVLWVEDIIDCETIERHQKEALEALVDHRFVAMACGSGVGKTATLAWAGLWFLTTHPFCVVPCTAPNSDLLHAVLWNRGFTYWIKRSKGGFLQTILDWNNKRIFPKNFKRENGEWTKFHEEWFIVNRTSRADEHGEVAEGLSGFHSSEGLLILVDEASGVDESIFAALEGSLTEPNTYMMMASNPTRATGSFARAFSTESSLWYRVHASSLDSKFVDPGYEERMAARFLRTSNTYRAKVLGLFPKDSSDYDEVFTPDELKRIATATNKHIDEVEPDIVVIGMDCARYGNDLTVFIARHGYEIVRTEAAGKMDGPEVAEWCWPFILDIANEFPTTQIHINIDAIGIGASPFDMLTRKAKQFNQQTKKACRVYVHGIQFQSKSNDPQYYNVRSEAFFNTKELLPKLYFRKHALHQRIIDDFRNIKQTFKNNRIYVESKDDIKKRRGDGLSPDFGDAFILATNVFHKKIVTSTISSSPRVSVGVTLSKPSNFGKIGPNPGRISWSH